MRFRRRFPDASVLSTDLFSRSEEIDPSMKKHRIAMYRGRHKTCLEVAEPHEPMLSQPRGAVIEGGLFTLSQEIHPFPKESLRPQALPQRLAEMLTSCAISRCATGDLQETIMPVAAGYLLGPSVAGPGGRVWKIARWLAGVAPDERLTPQFTTFRPQVVAARALMGIDDFRGSRSGSPRSSAQARRHSTWAASFRSNDRS
jgi:hypothetical protein